MNIKTKKTALDILILAALKSKKVVSIPFSLFQSCSKYIKKSPNYQKHVLGDVVYISEINTILSSRVRYRLVRYYEKNLNNPKFKDLIKVRAKHNSQFFTHTGTLPFNPSGNDEQNYRDALSFLAAIYIIENEFDVSLELQLIPSGKHSILVLASAHKNAYFYENSLHQRYFSLKPTALYRVLAKPELKIGDFNVALASKTLFFNGNKINIKGGKKAYVFIFFKELLMHYPKEMDLEKLHDKIYKGKLRKTDDPYVDGEGAKIPRKYTDKEKAIRNLVTSLAKILVNQFKDIADKYRIEIKEKKVFLSIFV